MTRLSLCAFLSSALTVVACNDVPIGGDGSQSRRDAGADVTPADLAPDVRADLTPDVLADLAPDVLADLASDIRPYQPPDVPADLASDIRPYQAPDVPADLATDATICSGANPAAQTCRKTANDCIPSSCSCSADGFWHCTADCPVNVPLCADAGTPDLASDVTKDAYVYPNDEQSCLKATSVPVCDIFSPYASVTRAVGGPLLVKVEVTAGSCNATSVCDSGCESIGVVGQTGISVGATCDLLVTSIDGRSQSIKLTVVTNPSPSYLCCGYPLDGHGMWVALNSLNFSPSPIVVDFTGDGGAGTVDVAATKDVGADGTTTPDLGGDIGPNPCAKCTASEVCVQSFDGMCGGRQVSCNPVSDTCRNKLTAANTKTCYSIPECESEFCSSPYRCIYSSPCATEVPEAAIYCYGP